MPRGLPNLQCAYTSIAGRGYNPRQRGGCSFLVSEGVGGFGATRSTQPTVCLYIDSRARIQSSPTRGVFINYLYIDSRARIQSSPTTGVFISKSARVSEVSVPRGLPNLQCAYIAGRGYNPRQRGECSLIAGRGYNPRQRGGCSLITYTSIAGRGYNPRQRGGCSFLSQRGCRRFRCHAVYPTYSVLMIAGRGYNPRQRGGCSFLKHAKTYRWSVVARCEKHPSKNTPPTDGCADIFGARNTQAKTPHLPTGVQIFSRFTIRELSENFPLLFFPALYIICLGRNL